MLIKLMLQKTKQLVQNRGKKITLYALAGVTLLLIAAVSLTFWFYNGRTMPGVVVGSESAGQKMPEEIQALAQEQQAALQITFVDDTGKQKTVPAKDVGVVIDTKMTAKNALEARRSENILDNLSLWSPKKVPLVFKNDPGMLKEYIRQNYASIFVDAKDAELSYNDKTQQFDIKPGTNGKGFDIKKFESILPDLALNPRPITLTVSTAPVEPLIQPTGLAGTQAEVNKKVKLTIQFMRDGKSVYKATPADIANWIHFIPDATKGTVAAEFDKAKMQQFITKQVSPKVTVAPIDRKVIIDKQTGVQTVLSAGRAGWHIKDAEDLTKNVLNALVEGRSLDQPISIGEAPMKTVTMTGSSKWIEIDLSQQKLTMYVGDAPVQSFYISSGKAKTPTRTGEFRIRSKISSQTMTGTIAGEYYYLPNVKWVNYFDGDAAIHGTYWHSNFGRPMSHGCVNMTEAAAKILYDFAPIGTKVIVHQ